MHHKRMLNSLAPSLIPDRESIRSMAQESLTFQGNPFAGIFVAVCRNPLLLSPAIVIRHFSYRWSIGNCHSNMLILDQRQRFERTQNPSLKHGFQFPQH
jgi:hypothetical protein